jgi:hypothetical protein
VSRVLVWELELRCCFLIAAAPCGPSHIGTRPTCRTRPTVSRRRPNPGGPAAGPAAPLPRRLCRPAAEREAAGRRVRRPLLRGDGGHGGAAQRVGAEGRGEPHVDSYSCLSIEVKLASGHAVGCSGVPRPVSDKASLTGCNPNSSPAPQLSVDERRLLLLAGCLFPLRRAAIPAAGKPGRGGGGAPVPVSSYIIRESIKWRVKEVDGTALLHEVAPQLAELRARLAAGEGAGGGGDAPQQQQPQQQEGGGGQHADVRVALGHAIRKLKQHWRLGVLLTPLLQHPSCAQLLGVEDVGGEGPSSSGGSGGAGGGGATERAAAVAAGRDGEAGAAAAWAAGQVGAAQELLAAVKGFGLEDCWQWKPLLDGKEVGGLWGGAVACKDGTDLCAFNIPYHTPGALHTNPHGRQCRSWA